MNGNDRTQSVIHEIFVDIHANNLDLISDGKLVGEGPFEFPCRSSIIANLGSFNGITKMLEIMKFRRRIVRQEDFAIEDIPPAVVVGSVGVAVIEFLTGDVVCQLRDRPAGTRPALCH